VDKVVQEITPLGSISYTYDALGRRTSMQVAGQPAVNYQYDPAGRLTGISTQNPEHGTQNFSFAYDALGRRISLTYPNGATTIYTYDKASRLLTLKHLNSLNIELEVLNYLYDRNGNRVAMDRLNVTPKLPIPVTNATYNEANQLLTFQPEGDAVWDLSYDENGNLTSINNSCGTTTYTWDARNRLVGINGFTADCSPLTAHFKYDALGRRIEKTINGRTVQYLYDGLDIVQEIEDGMVRVNYIRTLNIDEPLTRISSDGTIRYYHTDALGSVIALTDETGTVRTQYNYSPFGETDIIGESSENPFQYTGRENDNTGLYYYRARYYSPGLKRFISEDPIGLLGGINFYQYVGNSPINWADLLGLFSIKEALKDPRVRGAATLGTSYLLNKLAERLEPGKLRGAVYLLSAAFALESAASYTTAAAASFVVAFTTAETGMGAVVGVILGSGFTYLAIYDINQAVDYTERALKDLSKTQQNCRNYKQ